MRNHVLLVVEGLLRITFLAKFSAACSSSIVSLCAISTAVALTYLRLP